MSIITDSPRVDQLNQSAANESQPARAGIVTSGYFRWQRAPDVLLTLALCLPGLPLILVLVLLVRMSSSGPAIFRQIRVGRNGRTFTIYKLRTMCQDAEATTGPTWATADDPRVTRVGRFIRALHLDELPQLLNVLWGDMALVGPRPERPEFTHLLARKVPGYLDRLAVRPGITGLAQINLPPDTDLESVRRKVVLDREYVERAGLLMDLRILLCTCFRALGIHGTVTRRFLRLDRWEAVMAATRSPAAADPGASVQAAASDGEASPAEAHQAAPAPVPSIPAMAPHVNGRNGVVKGAVRSTVSRNRPR